MRAPKLTAAIVGVTVIALALLPSLRDVYRISQVAKQYRLESAVQQEIIKADAVHKPSVDEVLDPKFMTKYGLDSGRYLDAQGYFSPTGNDWATWSLETRTAAILMWKNTSGLSAWRIYRAIRHIDDYYRTNDRSVPVVKVVNASVPQ